MNIPIVYLFIYLYIHRIAPQKEEIYLKPQTIYILAYCLFITDTQTQTYLYIP